MGGEGKKEKRDRIKNVGSVPQIVAGCIISALPFHE
jgi:hypothetical protein